MQRTGIARASSEVRHIACRRTDGNLDPQTSWDILDILKEIHKIGTTIVMATHNSGIVNDLKKRTIVLEHGKVISDEEKGRYHVPIRAKGKKDHASTP
jgi:cell division transport system ATP-binding protein